jgi:hypothetical protein
LWRIKSGSIHSKPLPRGNKRTNPKRGREGLITSVHLRDLTCVNQFFYALENHSCVKQFEDIFLWQFAKSKVLTRDNLAKRSLNNQSCFFCAECESALHLFFDCCVAQQLWFNTAKMLGLSVGQNFESIAKLWLSDKKYKLVNVCTSAALWALWKTMNDILFKVVSWTGMRRELGRCA